MNRRGFLKFLSTVSAAIALPAVGAAPALGLQMPGEYCDMRFDRPIAAPPGSRFQRCWFSESASGALPHGCQFFSCFFDGPAVVGGDDIRMMDCQLNARGRGPALFVTGRGGRISNCFLEG